MSEYWSEYDRIDGLANWYTEPWHCRDLYLDALDWKPALAEYIQRWFAKNRWPNGTPTPRPPGSLATKAPPNSCLTGSSAPRSRPKPLPVSAPAPDSRDFR